MSVTAIERAAISAVAGSVTPTSVPVETEPGSVTCLACRRLFRSLDALNLHIRKLMIWQVQSAACVRVVEQARFGELAAENDRHGYQRHAVWLHECRGCRIRFYSPGRYTKVCGRLPCLRALARAGRQRRSVERRGKVCRHCHEPFTATRKDGRHCSPACRQAAYRARVTAKAADCKRTAALFAEWNAQLHGGFVDLTDLPDSEKARTRHEVAS